MKRLLFSIASLAVASSIASAVADAQAPVGTSFGPLAAATFGGSGIPNQAVQLFQATGLTLGLAASERCGNSSPPTPVYNCGAVVTNNGAGTFFAAPGVGNVNPSPIDPYATWNFNWYIGGFNSAEYTYVLGYDFNPIVGNGTSFTAPLGGLGVFPAGTENSWNLGMNFLDQNAAAAPNFDPTQQGEYYFSLEAFNRSQQSVGKVSMLVNTSTVPEPSTYALMASGLLALGLAARRRRAALAASTTV